MNKEEALKIVGLIKVSYQYSYKDYSENDFLLLAELFCKHFEHHDYSQVYRAVNDYIDVEKFPPTIADIKRKMFIDIEDMFLSEEEAWEMVKGAGRNDYSNAEIEYNSLPIEIRNVITINTLVEIGKASDNEIPFIKKGFIDSYRKSIEKETESILIESSYRNNDLLDMEDNYKKSLPFYEIKDKEEDKEEEDDIWF